MMVKCAFFGSQVVGCHNVVQRYVEFVNVLSKCDA